MVKMLNSENFHDFINQDSYTVVDCYADWCGPCKMLGPVLEDVSEKVSDVQFGKLNVDVAQDIAQELSVWSIPLVVLFKNGKMVNKSVGYRSEDEVMQFLSENK